MDLYQAITFRQDVIYIVLLYLLSKHFSFAEGSSNMNVYLNVCVVVKPEILEACAYMSIIRSETEKVCAVIIRDVKFRL